jgi:hypothetical protein
VLALAELQAGVRRAVVEGDPSAVAAMLAGGDDPRRRLSIHHRHYVTSLTTALLTRFPATIWLVGSGLVTAAAQAFVAVHPPTRPCIAEYGEDFPEFLAAVPGASQLHYLEAFARLDWHLGRLALAVEHPAVASLSGVRGDRVGNMVLAIQPGVHYLHLDWPVDALISVFLSGTEPDQFELRPDDIRLEVRGVRGELRMTRLAAGHFAFRTAVAEGASLDAATLRGTASDAAFDGGAALTSLLTDGLVTGVPGDSLETRS